MPVGLVFVQQFALSSPGACDPGNVAASALLFASSACTINNNKNNVIKSCIDLQHVYVQLVIARQAGKRREII